MFDCINWTDQAICPFHRCTTFHCLKFLGGVSALTGAFSCLTREQILVCFRNSIRSAWALLAARYSFLNVMTDPYPLKTSTRICQEYFQIPSCTSTRAMRLEGDPSNPLPLSLIPLLHYSSIRKILHWVYIFMPLAYHESVARRLVSSVRFTWLVWCPWSRSDFRLLWEVLNWWVLVSTLGLFVHRMCPLLFYPSLSVLRCLF